MKKRLSLVVAVLMLAIVVAACGTKNTDEKAAGSASPKEETTVKIKHKLGEIDVKKNPKKVVVFDFGALDTLDKLGVEVTGVPQKSIPSYLDKYKDSKYQNVGGLKEPDFEKINEIKPDLIIISGRQQDSYKQFTEIAPTIYSGVDTDKYMDSFKENVKTLAQIFGKESEAEKELKAIDDSIKQLNEKASASGKNGLIILANDGKVSTYGPKSRFGIIHDVFGVKAVDDKIEVSTHGQSASFEYMAEKNPDYLFVIDRGAVVGGKSSAKQVVENEMIRTTKAYKENHVVYLDPNYWYLSGGGLISVSEMVKEVGAAFK
ncbi:siderophore ABC transporter substrate-binding protein [Paenibacillus larvae]